MILSVVWSVCPAGGAGIGQACRYVADLLKVMYQFYDFLMPDGNR
jgi:hypothetical protein